MLIVFGFAETKIPMAQILKLKKLLPTPKPNGRLPRCTTCATLFTDLTRPCFILRLINILPLTRLPYHFGPELTPGGQ